MRFDAFFILGCVDAAKTNKGSDKNSDGKIPRPAIENDDCVTAKGNNAQPGKDQLCFIQTAFHALDFTMSI